MPPARARILPLGLAVRRAGRRHPIRLPPPRGRRAVHRHRPAAGGARPGARPPLPRLVPPLRDGEGKPRPRSLLRAPLLGRVAARRRARQAHPAHALTANLARPLPGREQSSSRRRATGPQTAVTSQRRLAAAAAATRVGASSAWRRQRGSAAAAGLPRQRREAGHDARQGVPRRLPRRHRAARGGGARRGARATVSLGRV
mmetsp:Transcript_20488/g.65516  ORF Transcript_20488/g.65516 Transcript_20488/m.65516 type:complete len:201 (-) Transcript_20488:227-829(-)